MGRIDDALKRAAAAPVNGSEGLERHNAVATLQSTATVADYPTEVPGAPPATERATAPASSRVAPPQPPLVPRVLAASRKILRGSSVATGKLVTDPDVPKSSIEQYRRLAAALHDVQAQHSITSVLISSASPGDGKTVTSTNLALTLAESYGRRVLLIDTDLRRPTVHEVFRLPNVVGLSDGLKNDTVPLPLVQITGRLTVLPAGRPHPNPTAALTSERMQSILTEAARQFDWVILDSPPIGLLADAKLMASLVDGVVLVVGAGSTDFQLARTAIEEVGRERIIGTVLNRVSPDVARHGHYDDYYAYTDSAQDRS